MNNFYIGKHTLAEDIPNNKTLTKKFKLLSLNNGKLPPYILTVGDIRRLMLCSKLFDKDSVKKRKLNSTIIFKIFESDSFTF